MPAHLSKRTLLVISDTAMSCRETPVAFEPVVRELESLLPLFDSIVWLGCKASGNAGPLRAVDKRIKLVIMPSVTHHYLNAARVILSYPVFLFFILRWLPAAAKVHTRGPSHPALIAIMFSVLFKGKTFWHKYAGSWESLSLPLSYKFQKRLLTLLASEKSKVTINGKWGPGNRFIYDFENPCFSEPEREQANVAALSKSFDAPYSFLFAGRLDANKGIAELIHALSSGNMPLAIKDVYIAGEGPLKHMVLKAIENRHGIRVHYLGAVSRSRMNELYNICQFLILPSRSEGFPKVVAEAAAYGCISIATAVSSIPQYINDGVNGFLLSENTPSAILEKISVVVVNSNLKAISRQAVEMSKLFTYEHFRCRIAGEVFQ